ncbi:MAG TPA: outer membrane protein assembly factor BamD [Gemmatimonadaceae bacterium]|nr:outer membrane protein assembly factor BamD [Gemmatimonadaceae bacterium]
MHARTLTTVVLAAAAALSACRGRFHLNRFPDSASLYAAATSEYQKGHWTNAIAAFEKLTNELPARDTLLPRAYWYLANAHSNEREHLLAAQSFTRLYESFPDDTLADDAALEAARSYRRLWRKPELDATYGETALATYNTLLGLYPTTEHADEARREIADLEQWFATKNYQTGMFYFRQKLYDSGILYFRYIVERWPSTPRARDAMLRLAESYRAISYREDLNETCTRLRAGYPTDAEVGRICEGTRTVDTTAAAPRPAASPDD